MIKVHPLIRLILSIGSVFTLVTFTVAPDHQAQAATCADILVQALSMLKASCQQLGRDEACYGNTLVVADLRESLPFAARGDQVPVQSIRTLTTSPFDEAREEWGLSLLKLKTNLPDTLPGQNVTVLVYGETTLANDSGNMQAFYFSTGLGAPQCKEMPADGVLIRAPQETTVTFRANGVDVRIGSTVLMSAAPNDKMTFTLIEGSAMLTSDGMQQEVNPLEMVTIPLGGTNGLQAIGVPSVPLSVTLDPALQPLLQALDSLETTATPVPIYIPPSNSGGAAPTVPPVPTVIVPPTSPPSGGQPPPPPPPPPTPTRLFGG